MFCCSGNCSCFSCRFLLPVYGSSVGEVGYSSDCLRWPSGADRKSEEKKKHGGEFTGVERENFFREVTFSCAGLCGVRFSCMLSFPLLFCRSAKFGEITGAMFESWLVGV